MNNASIKETVYHAKKALEYSTLDAGIVLEYILPKVGNQGRYWATQIRRQWPKEAQG